ncbi:YeeE/YedE family protein [Thalassospira sp.]|uniref:YeeE/YedE family protein n=1 Tax=Thalassospira sp. TaxID=1912094 RepID=UPI000C66A77D|nr:YeeE/YedE family protein [Thalassospira sp.]MBC05636.1 mmebrane protein [Thalassospira sp.]|tara:strand:+ start:16532 stop:17626 length:1095 start_codon:yes stop_codon:yes gene_type:complete
MLGLDNPWALPLAGILTGIVVGFVARRQHFCTMAALERYWFAANSIGLRAWVLAAITALLCTQTFVALGVINLSNSFYITPTLPIAGSILGGLMFGFGMAFVGTCGFGAIIRLGGGNLRALVVLTGIGLAAIAALRGVTGHFRVWFLDPLSIEFTSAGSQSIGAILSHASGVDLHYPIALLASAVGLWWVFRSSDFRAERAKALGAIVIGACISLGWVWTTTFAQYRFVETQIEAGSFVTPVGDTIMQIITVTGILPDYGVGLVIGVFLGAALAAWKSNDLRWEACDDARELGRHLLGAFLMGTGGVFALGCTIGQGVSAFSTLAISSPIVMISIAIGARVGLGVLLEGSPFGFLRAISLRWHG